MLIPVMICLLAFRPMDAITVKGKITNDSGSPLSGVSVLVKSTNIGTVSGSDGRFQLTLSDERSTLVFSAVGYATQEIKLTGNKELNVTLKFASNALQDVVVTGHGVAAKRMITGAAPGLNISRNDKSNYNYSVAAPGNGYYEMRTREPRSVEFNTEGYDAITETRFLSAKENPLSTFSIDVDAASYSNIRRFLNQGQLPPAGAVRIEEMVNYFKYDYPQPTGEHPFSINTEVSNAPWNKDHKLVLIGLQGKRIPTDNLPASNLVFLIDVSGSMGMPEKLPLVKASMKMLVDQLREKDKVAIVVYAGAAGLVLPSTSGEEKTKIKDAIDNLEAGGLTAGGAGIRLAYKTANDAFVKGGNNRVILCSDGDFNVGESSDDAMERLIEKERNSGVFLTILGYGMGNYKDNKMQKLADKGNGNHAYIDGISEAKKVLVNEFGGTLFTIAKDVKLQVEFNPAVVQGYRLIGYENRMLAKEDFNDDKKDAGELGSGHTVTALYEIIPVGVKSGFMASVDPLKYQKQPVPENKGTTDDLFTVKFRYKAPDGDKSKLLESVVKDQTRQLDNASENFRFATAVAEMGLLLRDSKFKGSSNYDHIIKLAKSARGEDEEGYRAEFIRLVSSAKLLAKGQSKSEIDGDTGKR